MDNKSDFEPIFGIAPDGKLVEAVNMDVWDNEAGSWDTLAARKLESRRGYTLGYFASAKPISPEEAEAFMLRSKATKSAL